MTKLIFEISVPNRVGYRFPVNDVPSESIDKYIPKNLRRQFENNLPEVSEIDIIRHYVNLSRKNFGVDVGFYPLGSCTMKYNPKINEDVAKLPGFTNLHPMQSDDTAQGILELQYKLLGSLCEITGMKWGTLQPYAGAHGEYTGMKIFKAYFKKRGEHKRKNIIVPDSAHGTNPASANVSGFNVVEIKSDKNGLVSVEELKKHLNDELAGLMLTNPNTLGIFEKEIVEIASLVHKAGGLLYYDGANFNAILEKVRPGDMMFDVVHLNLHKTFSTPHGGGGPGAGPVLVSEKLMPFLPIPDISFVNGKYSLATNKPDTIGRVSGFFGNIAVLVRAYTYILTMGRDGLKEVSEKAVLNANYLRKNLSKFIPIAYDTLCKHEFVLSGEEFKNKYGVSTLDIAKRLLDYNIHPPTIYFPLIVHEAMMIEPTETESKETLDTFIDVLRTIVEEIEKNPDILHNAPTKTPVQRLDEVKAAKDAFICYKCE